MYKITALMLENDVTELSCSRKALLVDRKLKRRPTNRLCKVNTFRKSKATTFQWSPSALNFFMS